MLAHPRTVVRWVGVAALHLLDQCLQQYRKEKLRIKTRDTDAARVAIGWRAGACGHSGGRTGLQVPAPKRTSQPPALHAVSQSAGV